MALHENEDLPAEHDALWQPVDRCGCDPATGMHAVTCVFWPLYVTAPGVDS